MEKKYVGSGDDKTFIEKVVKINRVNKVVKGGKRLAFAALIIVGDEKCKVGMAIGKSKEVPLAIKKGIENAKKHLYTIPIVNGTIPHQIIGKFGASTVVLRPARPGTGVIAGGSVRVLLEVCGVKDIVAKQTGSSNAINAARAALDGLLRLKTLDSLLKRKPASKQVNSNQAPSKKTEDVKVEEIQKEEKK